MAKLIYILISCIAILPSLVSASDILVWQGQYYTGTTFNTGTYEFNFSVYDALTGGDICYSNITNLTTGNFGEWKIEQSGVNSVCNNISKDYYLNININGIDQTPRRRLTLFSYLRKNVNENTTGNITANYFIGNLTSGYYNITSQMCYYANNATERSDFTNTYNSTYDAKVSDNTSFNQSLTDSLYYGISNPLNFINSSYNSTYDAKISDNQSWNQTLANSLYYSITNPNGYISTWTPNTTTEMRTAVNNSGFYNITANNSNYLSGLSFSTFYNASNPSGYINSFIEVDPLWSANYSALNSSWSSTYNSTYDAKPSNTYNATYDAKPSNTYNATYDAKPSNTYNATYNALISDNTSWNQSLADSLYAPLDSGNASWNETYADTKYQQGSELFNTTLQVQNAINSTGYYNITSQQCYYVNNATERTAFLSTYNASYEAGGNASWNETRANALYYPLGNPSGYISSFTELDPRWSANYTAFNNSWSSTFNSTYDAKVSDNTSWNEPYADTKYALIGAGADNTSWNQTYANSLFVPYTGASTDIDLGTYNITNIGAVRANYYYGQPTDGAIGSGILWASAADATANLYLNLTGGLNVSYPAFKMRLITSEPVNLITYCDIPAGLVTVPDNAHTAYYLDSNCAIQTSSLSTSVLEDISPGGKGDFMNIMAHDGHIEVAQGRTIEQKVAAKLRQTIFESSNLDVVSGFQRTNEVFPNITIASGHYVYIRDIVAASAKANTSIEIISHLNSTNWLYSTQQGLNLTYCDNGTATVQCTGTGWRRYFIFVIGWNGTTDTTEIHQLLPSLTTTYTTAANCLDTTTYPVSYVLPTVYTYTAVPLYAFCAQRTVSGWTTNWVDLRKVKTGTATMTVETDPIWTADKALGLTGNYSLSSPCWMTFTSGLLTATNCTGV